MSCCLFLTVGCQQKKQGFDDKSVSQAIQKVIQIKYPGATITDYDKDAAGVEVDIKDKGVKKEVLLGKNNEWLSTKFDIHAEDVCLLYTSPSPRDGATSRMPSSA